MNVENHYKIRPEIYTEADLDYWAGIAKRNYFTYGFFAGTISAGFIATLIILLR